MNKIERIFFAPNLRILLEAGANPNGHDKNLCTPLAVMAQRGFYEGLRLLCQFGADTQDVFRLMTGLPGTTFKCFLISPGGG